MSITAERLPTILNADPGHRTHATEHHRIAQLMDRCDRLERTSEGHEELAKLRRIRQDLALAQAALDRRRSPCDRWNGRPLADVYPCIHAADAELVTLTPPAELRAIAVHVLAHTERYLPRLDQRRIEAEKQGPDRHVLADALRAAYAAGDQAHKQLLTLRNVVLIVFMVLTGGAGFTAAAGACFPEALSLCFQPDSLPVACPAGGTQAQPADIFMVQGFGAFGAVLSMAFPLRYQGPSGMSYAHMTPLLAVLKLPLGALTAVAGILLIHGGFVPGLSDLDQPAQIAAWALFFGATQQVVSRLFDSQAGRLEGRALPGTVAGVSGGARVGAGG
ncbi:hypothetical protein M1L60_09225 [Actinoplanes sp. TRM 88003]|uniref:Uncharacterized protein n=1 Tax=Paractinoplanes aksuensis TaxID=2939490 RepID=A0ABT1DL74_9ACTN|nr:hypothetical protein [Actinoplanes aksuensis]MCO8270775.1 hypothetical protein [Actinoplanes aksuensis]